MIHFEHRGITKQIAIVVHCYAIRRPVFASMLRAQLSSLILHPPKTRVSVDVCCHEQDNLVLNVVREFSSRGLHVTADMAIGSHLMRRAIGRNACAKLLGKQGVDIVWHCDADYFWHDGCLDTLASVEFPHALVYPREASIHKSHAIGDRELARVNPGELFEPDLSLFEPWKPPYAIGGLQITTGENARKGYLDGTKWTQPVPDATDFLDTKEDRAYRAACGGSKPIDIPNLFRLRHSVSSFESAEKRLAQTAGKS